MNSSTYAKPVFLAALKNDKRLTNIAMNIAVIGARWTKDDQPLIDPTMWGLFAPNYKIFAFDPDETACKALLSTMQENGVTWPFEVVPAAVLNGSGVATIHVTQDPSASSFLKPCEHFCRRMQLTDHLKVVNTLEVPVTSLDHLFPGENQFLEFLQIDVQGAELSVFEGAKNLMRRGVLGLIVEVAFCQVYEGQPHFADIVVALRTYGLHFVGFTMANSDQRKDIPLQSDKYPGRPTWANAIFLRDPIDEANRGARLPQETFLKTACIADLLGVSDICLELLVYLTTLPNRKPEYNFADIIYAFFREFLGRDEDEVHRMPVIQKIRHHFVRHKVPPLPCDPEPKRYIMKIRNVAVPTATDENAT